MRPFVVDLSERYRLIRMSKNDEERAGGRRGKRRER